MQNPKIKLQIVISVEFRVVFTVSPIAGNPVFREWKFLSKTTFLNVFMYLQDFDNEL